MLLGNLYITVIAEMTNTKLDKFVGQNFQLKFLWEVKSAMLILEVLKKLQLQNYMYVKKKYITAINI